MKLKIGYLAGNLRLKNPSKRLRSELLNQFTYPNPAYANAMQFSPYSAVSSMIPKTIDLAYEASGAVVVPRGFDPELHLSEKAQEEFKQYSFYDNRITSIRVATLKPMLSLNKEQNTLLRSFSKSIDTNSRPFGNYLFCAPTSIGKTITQAMVAYETGMRTLVLCNTHLIMQAWYDDLRKLFGLGPPDIGLIKTDTWRMGDSFTLASVQTLIRRQKKWSELNEFTGTVILDEAQLISSPSVYRFISQCPAKFHIGATATPKTGPSGFYLPAFFGTPLKRIAQSQEETQHSFPIKDVTTIHTKLQYAYEMGMLDYTDLINTLCVDEDRNKLIIEHVKKDLDESKYNCCLVTSKRVAHVHLLHEMFGEAGIDSLMLTGESKNREAVVKMIMGRKVRVLIATDALIKLGANINTLNRIHIAVPMKSRSDLIQLMGRIRRKAPNKVDALGRYYLDRSVVTLWSAYKSVAMSVFRHLKIKRYLNTYMA